MVNRTDCLVANSLGERLEEKQCNEHNFAGDEICIAKQDLMVGIDSGTSIALHQDGQGLGFNILRIHQDVAPEVQRLQK